jgi:acyl dehydratase
MTSVPDAVPDRRLSSLTGSANWFEDFPPGRRLRHARSSTIGEFENQYISKQVMNTAEAHWNEEIMRGSVLGNGQLVFGLITASITFGLASQDTGENGLGEFGLNHVRFLYPVHHGDTITSYTEVLSAADAPGRPDAGVVRFKHWGLNQSKKVVCEFERTTLIKRRSHWAADEAPSRTYTPKGNQPLEAR